MVEQVIHLVIWLVVIGLIFWILLWLVGQVPLPEPFNAVARTVILVVGAIVLILLLLQFAGIVGGGKMPRLGELLPAIVARAG